MVDNEIILKYVVVNLILESFYSVLVQRYLWTIPKDHITKYLTQEVCIDVYRFIDRHKKIAGDEMSH